MAARMELHRGASLVVGVDLVPERLSRAHADGVKALDLRRFGKGLGDGIRNLTDGRATDAVIDAVGMEAHGAPLVKAAQWGVGLLPDAQGREIHGPRRDRPAQRPLRGDRHRPARGDRLVVGVYGGAVDPMPLLTMFDKQIQLRMGQANAKHRDLATGYGRLRGRACRPQG